MGRVRGERSACTESPPPTSIYTHLLKWDQNITLMSHCKSKDQNKNKCGATFFFRMPLRPPLLVRIIGRGSVEILLYMFQNLGF